MRKGALEKRFCIYLHAFTVLSWSVEISHNLIVYSKCSSKKRRRKPRHVLQSTLRIPHIARLAFSIFDFRFSIFNSGFKTNRATGVYPSTPVLGTQHEKDAETKKRDDKSRTHVAVRTGAEMQDEILKAC